MKITFERPQAIIVDFLSTCVKSGFIEKALFRFLRNHGKETIVQLWAKKDFMEVVALVRRQVRKDMKDNPNIPPVAEKTDSMETQQESLYANMMWYLENNKETNAHYRLKYALYEDAYSKDKVVTHVYTDVARNIKKWKAEGIRVYIFSHAWINTQRLFMKKTNHGELFSYIDGFHDTHELGPITEPSTFQKLVANIGSPGAETLFLTKGVAEGRAAKQAGIHSILVISHGHQLKRYAPEDLAAFERIRSFDELIWRGAGSQVASAGGSQMASNATGQVASNATGSQVASAGGSGSKLASGSGSKLASGAGSKVPSGTGSQVAPGSGTPSAPMSGGGSAAMSGGASGASEPPPPDSAGTDSNSGQ